MTGATDVYVFLGPSLPLAEARAILPGATYLPPAQMGDVHAVMVHRPAIICVIDGVFERVPAVWHKELLFALAHGVRVVGASSMGALRAAELHVHGMEGVGAVFEAFRDGTLTADDEVALLHAPADEGYRPLSEPMVNLRAGLAAARGILTSAERDALVAASRSRFYPRRCWARVFDDARGLGVDPARLTELRALVARDPPNVKRTDAIAALHHIVATRHVPARPATFDFEPTEFWHQLVATTARTAGTDARADTVLDHARIALDDAGALRHRALLALLASAEAERGAIDVTADQLEAAAARFRLQRDLASAERTHAFLADQGLSAEDFAELCRLDVIYEALIARAGRAHDAATLRELRGSGGYAGAARATESIDHALVSVEPALADAGLDEPALLTWYRTRFRPLRGGLASHAAQRGFPDTQAFLRALIRQYHAEAIQ